MYHSKLVHEQKKMKYTVWAFGRFSYQPNKNSHSGSLVKKIIHWDQNCGIIIWYHETFYMESVLLHEISKNYVGISILFAMISPGIIPPPDPSVN